MEVTVQTSCRTTTALAFYCWCSRLAPLCSQRPWKVYHLHHWNSSNVDSRRSLLYHHGLTPLQGLFLRQMHRRQRQDSHRGVRPFLLCRFFRSALKERDVGREQLCRWTLMPVHVPAVMYKRADWSQPNIFVKVDSRPCSCEVYPDTNSKK